MFDTLKQDLNDVLARDPAAHSRMEVFFCYPGFKAVRSHRRAHRAYVKGHYFLARLINFLSYQRTGIDIHPGAVLGRGVFIDHGTGVVIGETAEVGDDVTIYQGVTLGGTGKDVGKRHPTVGSGVMIGAGAKVLGPFSIGDNAKIAAGSVVLNEIPENCTAVGAPAHVVKRDGVRVDQLDQVNIPDPVAQEFAKLNKRIAELEEPLAKLQP